MKKRVISILLVIATLFTLTACMTRKIDIPIIGKNEKNQTENKNTITENKNISTGNNATPQKFTIQQLKAKYATSDGVIAEDSYIRPFYNVEQTTRFTFHFNSIIEPYKAISVHTDPKCGINSAVYQINDGYLTDNGVDVIVKPGKPILNTSDRKSGELDNYTWGNAPIYYICIHYDMNSSVVKELDEPIIIPFTIRNDVSTPNLTYSIDNNGTFRLNWKKIDGAVKYNIYRANPVKESAREYTRSECAYIGDHLKLLTTVSGDQTTFTDFGLDGKDGCSEYNGYTLMQNTDSFYTFYITAEDRFGNESAFSMAVEGWKHSNQLPYSFNDGAAFTKNEKYQIDNLPETVFVTMADRSTASFPINYTKLSESFDGSTARYSYAIQGTKLSGEILGDIVYKVNGQFQNKIESQFNVDTTLYVPENNIDIVPSNDVLISNSSNLDLSHYTDRGETNKFLYDRDEILAKADAEAARIITDGIFISDPSSIFKTTYKSNTYVPTDNTPVENNTNSNTPNNTEIPENNITEPTIETTTYPTTETTPETTPQIQETNNSTSEITSDNVVEEQIRQTQEDIENTNQIEIVSQGYKVFADSAEEEYLALQIINCEEEISLKAFPKLQNCEYLIYALIKVHYQNPYDMGMKQFAYDPSTQILYIEYYDTKDVMQRKQAEIANKVVEISNSIIKSGMTQEEKIEAIWNYLEQNTEYDNDALAAAENSGFTSISSDYTDAFTTYGIMCKQKGVCQSYAYTTKLLCDANGIKCNVLTGYMNKTLPHGWNVVELDGKWYWIDATNNANVTGIPYMVYQTSAEFALGIDYVLDNNYELDTNLNYINYTDSLRDWYARKGLMAADPSTIADIVNEEVASEPDQIFVKLDTGVEMTNEFMQQVAIKLMSGKNASKIESYRMGYAMGFMIFMK